MNLCPSDLNDVFFSFRTGFMTGSNTNTNDRRVTAWKKTPKIRTFTVTFPFRPGSSKNSLHTASQFTRFSFHFKSERIFGPCYLISFQGYREVILTRKTVKFIIRSHLAKSLASWSEDVTFPEEIFFATLTRINRTKFLEQGLVEQNRNKKAIPYRVRHKYLNSIGTSLSSFNAQTLRQ